MQLRVQLLYQLPQIAVLFADGVFIAIGVAAGKNSRTTPAGRHDQISQPPQAVRVHRRLKQQDVSCPGKCLRLLRKHSLFQPGCALLLRSLRVQKPTHGGSRLQRFRRQQA